ncbi:MAG: LuxR C-terminal-related transcriptional regulator [Planctomycetota bacterium]
MNDPQEAAATLEDPQAAGYAVLVVARDGRCLYSPNVEGLVDAFPWELCWESEGREKLREAFVQACMFRRRQQGVAASLRIGERAYDFEVTLEPTGSELVIGRLVRVFASRLSRREKDILSLVAGGASNAEISRLLGAEEGTIRSHLRNMREKLGVARPEALLLAAVGLGETRG